MPAWSLLLLVAVLSYVLAEPVARISFKSGDPSRSVKTFSAENVLNYDQFLLSEDREKLYVGARDTVLYLSIDDSGNLHLQNQISWPSDSTNISQCVLKAKSKETECLNFIRILLPVNNTHLYTCGTNAFNPFCTYINLDTFSMYTDITGHVIALDGRGQSPFDPQHKHTAVMVDGELYTGTMNNFKGNEPIIYRTLGNRQNLKTETSLGWLHADASFVGSFNLAGTSADSKVYFFFAETAREFDFFDKLTASRVARVCKNDAGGDKVLQKRWTTFLKAQLLCSDPDGFPFNVLQHVALLHPDDPQRSTFYGVFSSQWQAGGSSTSAVCSFQLKDIENVFDGNYKEQNKESSRWTPYTGPVSDPRPGSCSPGKFSDTDLNFMKDHFLMDGKVSPLEHNPLLIKQGLRYTQITVDSVPTISGRNYTVLFLGTDKGSLQKVVVVNEKYSHIIEELELLPNQEPVKNLLLASNKRLLYIGYTSGILQVPLANCSVYISCFDCILARDPYCAWDVKNHICRWAQSKVDTSESWLQDIENGHPNTTCSTQLPRGKATFATDTKPMKVANYTANYNTILKLQCPQHSALATYTWKHPLLKSSDKQMVTSQDTLVIIVKGDTLGLYECWAEENGFTYQVAKYWVKDPSGVDVTHKDSENTDSNMETSPQFTGNNYYTHFVVVTILLVSTLCGILIFVLYGWRDNLKAKSKIQGCNTPETEKLSDAKETTRLNGICQNDMNNPNMCCVPVSGSDAMMDLDNNTVIVRTSNGRAPLEDASDV
ncbi:semaphorin-4A isoform X1 [Pelobates fuscus]|uniref:semaphorin-4A isoform X1 n=1 Tax=Pelobates fuscus TaxID=191477 RepID=UPI002FE46A29